MDVRSIKCSAKKNWCVSNEAGCKAYHCVSSKGKGATAASLASVFPSRFFLKALMVLLSVIHRKDMEIIELNSSRFKDCSSLWLYKVGVFWDYSQIRNLLEALVN